MSDPAPQRGEIWLAYLDKIRPAVVLTRDPMGSHLHSVIAAPITSVIRGLSTEVAIGPEDGIRAQSVANLDNVRLVRRSRLIRRLGRVTSTTMDELCQAFSIAIGCDR